MTLCKPFRSKEERISPDKPRRAPYNRWTARIVALMARNRHRWSALLAAALWLPVAPAAAAPLPRRLGACSPTFIREIHYRLSAADANGVQIPIAGSGSAVSYTNGGYQVSYDTVPAIHSSREGDSVELCLSFVPDCSGAPRGDGRGRIYRARNLRTGGTWTLPDSQHSCGGA